MFFYSESIEVILRKQNLSAYIQSIIVSERSGRKVMPSPKLVQVVTASSVSDGVFDYPCTFTSEKQKKGSFLRLTKWEVNTRSCQLAIHEAQYLGGAGCEVNHGKKWDNERLKMLATSKVLSKHFVVLHEPTAGITEKDYPQFNFSALSRALAVKKQQPQEPQQKFQKTKKPFVQQQNQNQAQEVAMEIESSNLPIGPSQKESKSN